MHQNLKIVSEIEKIAASLEAKGLTKEAKSLDIICNTVEASFTTSPDMRVDQYKKEIVPIILTKLFKGKNQELDKAFTAMYKAAAKVINTEYVHDVHQIIEEFASEKKLDRKVEDDLAHAMETLLADYIGEEIPYSILEFLQGKKSK
jgi:hypothetical protein